MGQQLAALEQLRPGEEAALEEVETQLAIEFVAALGFHVSGHQTHIEPAQRRYLRAQLLRFQSGGVELHVLHQREHRFELGV